MKKFILFIVLFSSVFLFFGIQKSFAICDYGVDCGLSGNCPGSTRCCTLEGAYSLDACTASGASCHTYPVNCQSGTTDCRTTGGVCPGSGISHSCPTGQCALPYCDWNTGECLDYCYIPTPPETCTSVPGGNPTPTPVPGCNASCTVDGECNNLAGQYCFNSSDGPGATNTCRLQSDWYNVTCNACTGTYNTGGYLSDSSGDFECGTQEFGWLPPKAIPANPAATIYGFRSTAVGGALASTYSQYVYYQGANGNTTYGYEAWYGAHVGISAHPPLVVGEQVRFTGYYYVAQNTNGGSVQLHLGYFNGGTYIATGTSLPFLDMTPGWHQFSYSDMIDATKATADMLSPAFLFYGGTSQIQFYFDKLVLWHYPGCTSPVVPANQVSTLTPACGPNSVSSTFSWDNSTGASEYEMFISGTSLTQSICETTNGGVWTAAINRCDIDNIAQTGGFPGQTSLIFSGLSPNSTYTWGVRAMSTLCPASGYGSNSLVVDNYTCTIRARAVRINPNVVSCTGSGYSSAILDPVSGAQARFTRQELPIASSTFNLTSVYPAYTSSSPAVSGTYSVSSTNTPTGYSYFGSCPASQALVPTLANPNAEVFFDVGYSTSNAWFQTVGGSTHSNGELQSIIPSASDYFLTPAVATIYGGIVSYSGPSINFGSYYTGTPWLALNNGFLIGTETHTKTPTSYFNYYDSRLGGLASAIPVGGIASVCSGTCVYRTNSSYITTDSFSVSNNQKIIVLVNGALTIVGDINVAPGGFIIFITSNGIVLDESVSSLQGVYVTDGTFSTGSSATQLLGEGTFVADTFSLTRDLVTGNESDPAEKFTYRPEFWVNAPDEIKDINIRWQEVAP